MWSYFATPALWRPLFSALEFPAPVFQRQNHLWNLDENKTSHNLHSPEMCFLMLFGSIVSPKDNLSWIWSNKIASSVPFVEPHTVLHCLILPLFFFATESPAEAIKITTFGQSSISLITTWFSSHKKSEWCKKNATKYQIIGAIIHIVEYFCWNYMYLI